MIPEYHVIHLKKIPNNHVYVIKDPQIIVAVNDIYMWLIIGHLHY